jgi:predicted nucleic acid-binding protein
VSFVVDTCLLIDIFAADKAWAKASARLLARHQNQGLVISPFTFIELAPAFGDERQQQREYLEKLGVDYNEPWLTRDTEIATDAWVAHANARRAKKIIKRPMADILIGAFATRFSGLLTRNVGDFAPHFPALKIYAPR